MDFITPSPLIRLPERENIPDMAQPDGIRLSPSNNITLNYAPFVCETFAVRLSPDSLYRI
jgi:hypothetical protein